MEEFYQKSKLFHQLLSSNSEENVKNKINQLMNKMNITSDYAVTFMKTYNKNTEVYSDETLLKYFNLFLVLKHDFLDEYSNYIVNHYIFEKMHLLDKLCHHSIIINRINEKCKKYQWISKKHFTYISKHIKITHLFLAGNSMITDSDLKNTPHLISLNLMENKLINDSGLEDLDKLEEIVLWRNKNITDKGIKNKKKLRVLDLTSNNNITNNGIANLENLEVLILLNNEDITNDSVEKFKKLKFLNLCGNENITDSCLDVLPALEGLNLTTNRKISYQQIKKMESLRHLALYDRDNNISDAQLITLTQLRSINTLKRNIIDKNVISQMPFLEKVN